jgi:hypothetical protein
MLRNITHALSPTHTDVASAMTEIFTGSQLATAAIEAIKSELERKQAEIDALRTALGALGGTRAPKASSGKGTRRARTEAEKKAMSKAMKAAWRRRKAATQVPAAKVGKNAGKKAAAKKQAQAGSAAKTA